MDKRGGGISSTLVSVIGDEDTVTGFLLTGIGERNNKGEANFLVVDSSKQRILAKKPRRKRLRPLSSDSSAARTSASS